VSDAGELDELRLALRYHFGVGVVRFTNEEVRNDLDSVLARIRDELSCPPPESSGQCSTRESGGDFADGVIAFEGRRAEGQVFATFNEKAAALVRTAEEHAPAPGAALTGADEGLRGFGRQCLRAP
jgi:hypothetical protein